MIESYNLDLNGCVRNLHNLFYDRKLSLKKKQDPKYKLSEVYLLIVISLIDIYIFFFLSPEKQIDILYKNPNNKT